MVLYAVVLCESRAIRASWLTDCLADWLPGWLTLPHPLPCASRRVTLNIMLWLDWSAHPITKILHSQSNPALLVYSCSKRHKSHLQGSRRGLTFLALFTWDLAHASDANWTIWRPTLQEKKYLASSDRFALFSAAWLPGISKSLGWCQESNQPQLFRNYVPTSTHASSWYAHIETHLPRTEVHGPNRQNQRESITVLPWASSKCIQMQHLMGHRHRNSSIKSSRSSGLVHGPWLCQGSDPDELELVVAVVAFARADVPYLGRTNSTTWPNISSSLNRTWRHHKSLDSIYIYIYIYIYVYNTNNTISCTKNLYIYTYYLYIYIYNIFCVHNLS